YRAHPLQTAAGFFLLYVTVTSLSIPGAAVLTLVAGAIFGLGLGALLVSFAAALGATIAFLVSRFVLRDWVRSRYGATLARFERNLVVIGGGSAGLVTAYIAAAVRAKVTLIEKHRMGGDCLNTGCVPSKALIKSARVVMQMRRAADYGLRAPAVDFNFAEV